MSLFKTRFFLVLATVFLASSIFSGCSGKKSCSADTECKEGSYCSSGKCTEFKADDYDISFVTPADGTVITTADDLDYSIEGIQINVEIAVENTKNIISDGMGVILTIKNGSDVKTYEGTLAKGKAVFSLVTIPEAEVELAAYLAQNPLKKAVITLVAKMINITMNYLKGGTNGTVTALQDAVITDDDDSDSSKENGIQLDMTAETEGLAENDEVKIFFPEESEDAVCTAKVDKNGKAICENVTVPILSNVRMTVKSGNYSKSVEFKVDSKIHCGFLLNIENDSVLGKKDDQNESLSDLQFDLIINEITGCGKGSKLSIYVDSEEGSEPSKSFSISGNSVEERITLPKSSSSSDKRKIFVVIEDEEKNMKGSKSVSGIIVDLDDPALEITFPEVGQILNMVDDIDSEEAGLQVKFSGNSDDLITSPVAVSIKIGDTVISEQNNIDGVFEVLHTFIQSSPATVLTVVATDGAGNTAQADVQFSVSVDSELEFYSVCGKTGADIVNGMWLNLNDDTDDQKALLQCKLIIKVAEGTGATHISLKAGGGAETKKDVENDNSAEFDIDFDDNPAGYELLAKSYTGNNVLNQNNLTVRVDTVPPVVTLSNNLMLNNGETTSAVNITFDYECSEFTCYYNTLLDSEMSDLFSIGESRAVSGLADGSHTFKVKARDTAGNESIQTVFNWTVNTVKPETTITKDPGEATSNTTAEFEFESDKGAGTFYCKLLKEGVNFIPADDSYEECNTGLRDYAGLTEGNYVFKVYAMDIYGNEDPTPAQHSWILGTTPPETTITKADPSASPVSSTQIEFEFEADIQSTYECRLEKDGNTHTDWEDCSTKTKSYNSLEDGIYVFKVKATAIYGVEELTPATHNWIVDTTSPKIKFSNKPPLVSGEKSGNFDFSCIDATTCTMECKLDDGVFEDCTDGKFEYTDLADGNHRLIVVATDEVGNTSVAITDPDDEFLNDYTWNIDLTKPVAQIESGPANPTFQTNASFVFSANEVSSFECKLETDADWSACTSPKIYPTGTFGVAGESKSYKFMVKATDAVGNEGEIEEWEWTVDLTGVAIEWISPVPRADGTVVVGKSHDVYSGDPANYAIRVQLKVTGANASDDIIITGFYSPPGYTTQKVNSANNLIVGLEQGGGIEHNLLITVQSTTITQKVIVNTESPTITWGYPANNHLFNSKTIAPQIIFSVYNALAGMEVELVDADTNSVTATGLTAGSSGGTQEAVNIYPTIPDSCDARTFYGRLYDSVDQMTHYTNSVINEQLKTTRTIFIDRNPATIGDIVIPGLSDTDRVLNRADNKNPDPDGGMITDITVNISDPANPADSKRTVKLYTNNGAGQASVLLATLYNQGDIAIFENVALNDCCHTIKVEVTDCGGNITTTNLDLFTVDTVIPELTLTAPKGNSSNWRWIVESDDPALGTINMNGDFTGVEMEITSNETIGQIVEVIHTVYDYQNTVIGDPADITGNSSILPDGLTVKITLPDLVYGKHRFEVTITDSFGNPATIGDKTHELYEVDVIVPLMEFINVNDGDLFDVVPFTLQTDASDVLPQSSYSITALPVDSYGGSEDAGRFAKEWKGTLNANGIFGQEINLGDGWWRISGVIADDHFNQSHTDYIDIEIDTGLPSFVLKKGYGYLTGEGPIINGYLETSPAYLMHDDVSCTDDNCETDIEVWTNAVAGSNVLVSVNSGAEISALTTAHSGKSYSEFTITLDSSITNVLTVKVVEGVNESFDTYYIKIDQNVPSLTLLNPADCSGEEVCRRVDFVDNPVTPDYIELAELGYGYGDDAVSGGVLNFKPTGAIVFEVTGATAGKVVVESITGTPVAGIVNTESPILYNSTGDYYYADFSSMTVADDNENGQKDFDLIFKVIQHPSGAFTKYLVKLHVDLLKPSAINIAGNLSINKKTGEVSVDWVAIQGNNSNLGGNAGSVHEYDIRYQDYNEGICTIAAQFDAAKKPLETVAGPIPSPVVGDMSYDFFINRINNGQAGVNFKEADIHKNGNKYCFAVRAVDAVYASDGTVLAKNGGVISPNDVGEVKISWNEVVPASPGYHAFRLRNLGDLDGDGIDDFVIADFYKTINTENEDLNGKIKIYFSKGEQLFELNGEKDDRLGIGISSKADFNGDGFVDFAYTDRYGNVSVHLGGSSGFSMIPSFTFTAKDASTQNFRSIASGDYNKDGCDDILITAPEFSSDGISSRGAIFVYYSNCLDEVIDGDSPDQTFLGAVANARIGISEISAIGDVNKDGKTDFFMGNISNGHIIYGGTSGGTISSFNISGLESNSYPGRRVGYGDINDDGFDDMVIGNRSNIRVYYGSETGISNTPSVIINDVSPINYAYPPTVTNFAMAIPPVLTDLNGDGFSNIITASQKGLMVYYSFDNQLMNMPSFYDPFIDSTATNVKLLNTNKGILYCNNDRHFGDCHFINYGE